MGHAHKTRFWYLLGVFSKFSAEQPRHFYWQYAPGIFTPYEQRLLLSFSFMSRRKEAKDRTALLMAGWDLSIPWGRGDTPGEFLEGVWRPVLQILTLF